MNQSNHLNAQGEIVNQAALEKVAPVFLPLFESLRQALLQTFADNLHSLYAYGSIAEGRARPGQSDADFIVVLEQVDDSIKPRLDGIADVLQSEYAMLVSKIDLPFGTREEVVSKKNYDGWGSYLKILGVAIYGPDLRAELPDFKPSLALARGWNGDLIEQVAKVRACLQSEASAQIKQRAISQISAQICRAFFMLIAPEIQFWTPVLAEQVQHLMRYYPAEASHFRYLQQARQHGQSVADFAANLEQFEQQLLPLFKIGLGLK